MVFLVVRLLTSTTGAVKENRKILSIPISATKDALKEAETRVDLGKFYPIMASYHDDSAGVTRCLVTQKCARIYFNEH